MSVKFSDYVLCGSDYVLCDYRGKKPVNSGISYVPYIPKQIVETDEEREARIKRERALKSYAKVKLSNDNPHYRNKRGEIVERDSLTKKICLEIETWNSCSKDGCMTLIGVMYPQGYKKIWFNEDELTNFETYDKNGELLKLAITEDDCHSIVCFQHSDKNKVANG